MENEKLMMVLKEILEDQKNNDRLLIDIKKDLNDLGLHVEKLEEVLNYSIARESEINVLERSFLQQLEDIKKELGKTAVNQNIQKRILLFPEHNAKEYYSVVFRWIVNLAIVILGYFLLSKVIDTIGG